MQNLVYLCQWICSKDDTSQNGKTTQVQLQLFRLARQLQRLANDLILARYPSSMYISKWLHKKNLHSRTTQQGTIVHCNSCTSVELYINLKLRLVANFTVFDMCHQILYVVLATLFFSSLGSVGEVILTLFCMWRYTGHHQSY
jgi:hypothetical protein